MKHDKLELYHNSESEIETRIGGFVTSDRKSLNIGHFEYDQDNGNLDLNIPYNNFIIVQ